MANKVYRWRKPEFVITLTEGGSLQANTTYYLFGFFVNHNNLYPSYYHQGHSPCSNVYTFTTDSTKKSISVSWKTTGNITQFENAGSGQVRVYCSYHCLKTGNQITIMSGAYAGTYTITEETYNTFLITATYSGTYTTTWECYTLPNSATGIKVYMHTANPFDSDNVFIGLATKFSHSYTQNGYTTNPFTISAEFNTAYSGQNHWLGYCYPYKSHVNLVWNIGLPIIVIDTGNTLISTIGQLLKDAGVFNEFNFVTNNVLNLYAFLYVTTTYQPVIENYIINLNNCFMSWANAKFYKCVINATKVQARGKFGAKYQNSVLLADAQCDDIGTNLGDNIYFVGYNIQTSYDGLNSIFVLPTPSSLSFMVNNTLLPTDYAANFTVYIGGIYFVFSGTSGTTRKLRNVNIYSQGSYDIRVYAYNDGNVRNEYENVNTLRTNNRKVFSVQGGSPANHDYVCIRKKTIKIVDKYNNPIYNANIRITDNQNSIYNFYSDNNGNATIEVIEQTTKLTNVANDTGTNTYYEDFVITISKDGYETQKYYFAYGKLISDNLDIVCLSAASLRISSLSFTHPSLDNNDGKITIQATGGLTPYQYSIDGGMTWQSQGVFTGLAGGDYEVVIRDDEGTLTEGVIVTLKQSEYINEALNLDVAGDDLLILVSESPQEKNLNIDKLTLII